MRRPLSKYLILTAFVVCVFTGGYLLGRHVERLHRAWLFQDLANVVVDRCSLQGLVVSGSQVPDVPYGTRTAKQDETVYPLFGVSFKDASEARVAFHLLSKGKMVRNKPQVALLDVNSARSLRVMIEVGDRYYFLDELWPLLQK